MKPILSSLSLLFASCGAAGAPDGMSLPRSEPWIVGRIESAPIPWGGDVVEIVAARSALDTTSAGIEVWKDQALLSFAPIHGFGFVSAIEEDGVAFVFGTYDAVGDGIYRTSSYDLMTWEEPTSALPMPVGLRCFNSSVTAFPGGYAMAVEVAGGPAKSFAVMFATARTLDGPWTILPDLYTPDRYTACPALAWGGARFLLLVTRSTKGEYWIAATASMDFLSWGPERAILSAADGEGINCSDPALVEHEGTTWIYHASGDQATWGNVHRVPFEGSIPDLVEAAR